jgi:solute:Na+ symporter, SSS family
MIGIYASRYVKSAADFAIAGKRLPLFLSATTLFATWFGAETILGATAKFVEGGFLAVIEEPFGSALCLFLVGAFFAKRLHQMDILTFGDYFKVRYSKGVELVSSILMFLSFLGWTAAQFVAWGVMVAAVTGIPQEYGIVIGAVIIVVYTYFGGMWAVSLTDFVQTIVIILGLTFLLIDFWLEANGITTILANVPQGFFDFLPAPDFVSVATYASAWMAVGLGSIPSQDVLQRIMASRTDKIAVRASYLGGFMYLTIAMLPLFIGLFAKNLYPEIMGKDQEMLLPNAVKHTNIFIQIMFFGALLSAIMSTASGTLLAPSTVLAENLIKPYLKKELTDKQLLRLFRFCVFIFACIALGIASMKGNIYELASYASTVNLVCLFFPLLGAMFWKRASALGAMLSMLLGIIVWLYFEVYPTEIPSLLYGLTASFVGMLVGSLMRK